jgi:uroporphyrinogen decarboxylase
LPNKKFKNALERKSQTCPPIWLMRQAGRYHDHYQSLKKNYTFEELCKKPRLAAETAMGPINEFDFDVAILFSDILFPLEALGMDLSYNPGPQFGLHLDEENAGSLLTNQNPIDFMDFQGEAIERTIERLPEEKSLIGFVGGPWTLIAYACNVNKDLSDISISNFQVGLLENVILPLLKENIKLQLNAGAEIVMIFDSAAHQLADEDFKIYLDKTFNELSKEFPNKVGYYAKDGINYDIIIDKKNQEGISLAGMGLDSSIDLKDYFNQTGNGFIQGNFSENFLTLPYEQFLPKLEEFINHMADLRPDDRLGWVCGLGHGVLKTTPQENVKAFVTKIRENF